jgi:replicative DNA helicase
MQDLKGSSQYEQDASIIVLIHRPRDEQNPKQRTGTDILIVEKMREGEPDVLPVQLTPWADFAPRWTGPDLGTER